MWVDAVATYAGILLCGAWQSMFVWSSVNSVIARRAIVVWQRTRRNSSHCLHWAIYGWWGNESWWPMGECAQNRAKALGQGRNRL